MMGNEREGGTMSVPPFDRPGRFFKGNLHLHSTRSDGKLEPGAVLAAYRERGYDFVALTDHFLPGYDFPIVDTREWRTPGFATLFGAELHARGMENGEAWHILAVGLPLDFAPTAQAETGPQLAARAAAAGAFVAMAHPAWNGLSEADARSLEAAHAVEVYNTGCEVESERGESWELTDVLLNKGRRLLACATDDAHADDLHDGFGGWVMVRAAALEPDALLAALHAGHFYSSQGPEIHDVAIEGDAVRVACSPARSIHVQGHGSFSRFVRGEGLREATLALPEQRRFCRVTVVDAAGKRAWSNPIWLE
jgi:hypothetical protein